jgi:hypothetical protein
MKIMNLKSIVILLVLTLSSVTVFAINGRDIMEKLDKISRDSSRSMLQKTSLTTCKYSQKNKKMACTEKPRIKVMESVQKDVGNDFKDSKSVSILLKPMSEKGIGMLSYDYDEIGKDSDTWLYFSALGKVRRVISSSDEEDTESGSFFGTEFATEDIETLKIGEFTYKILKETKYAKRPVWIIEMIPTEKKARKSRYSKTIVWVDKERYITLKTQLYNKRGKLYKKMTSKKIENINGVWIAKKVTMNNLITKRVTILQISTAVFNVEVPETFLTKRTLTDFAFRERELAKLRKYLK